MNNKITTIFLGGIFSILLYLVFKGDISNYFKIQEVLNNAKVSNILFVNTVCEDSIKTGQVSNKCDEVVGHYVDQEKRYRDMIKGNRVSCSSFNDSFDANIFYQYINKEFVETYKKYGLGHFDHCTYDPYNLDANHDCNACEKLK